jgi:DNA modification methylase
MSKKWDTFEGGDPNWDAARIEESARRAEEQKPRGSRPLDMKQATQRPGRRDTGSSPFSLSSTAAGTYDTTLRGNRAFQAWTERWAREAYRVLKPGGHLMSFCATRTYHRMAAGIEDAGFEMRDMIGWLYGSGFPKSLDVSKAIDARAGAKREAATQTVFLGGQEELEQGSLTEEAWVERDVTRTSGISEAIDREKGQWADGPGRSVEVVVTLPATEAAKVWEGWGTALKPAIEPIAFARKPLSEGTVADNVLRHGAGAINVAAGAVPGETRVVPRRGSDGSGVALNMRLSEMPDAVVAERWPANVVASHLEECGPAACADGCPVDEALRQSRMRPASEDRAAAADVARFFYCAKPSRGEREAGLTGEARKMGVHAGPAGFAEQGDARLNVHPTVKPIGIMRWLVRMVVPPGGLVIDPFVGSGTTGCAAVLERRRFIGVDLEEEYLVISRQRIEHWRPRQMALFVE